MREGDIESNQIQSSEGECVFGGNGGDAHQRVLWKDRMASCFIVHFFMVCLHMMFQEQGGWDDP